MRWVTRGEAQRALVEQASDLRVPGPLAIAHHLIRAWVGRRNTDMSELACWNCGHSLNDVPRPISRHATCSKCFNELRCCRLCRHYDPQRTAQCFEERADPPLQKENANFCDFFAPKAGVFDPHNVTRSGSARAQLDELFAGPAQADDASTDAPGTDGPAPTANEPPSSKDDEARRKLDDLFG